MELSNIIELKIENIGYKLVDFKIKDGRTLKYEVVIYSDNGITHRDCQIVTNLLMEDQEIDKLLGEDYILEVSSPGIGRRLKTIKDFIIFNGKDIEYCLLNEKPSFGIIKGVENDSIIIYDTKNNLEKIINLKDIQYAKLKDIGG